MKKKNFNSETKLTLGKTTIVSLTQAELTHVNGGDKTIRNTSSLDCNGNGGKIVDQLPLSILKADV